MPEDKEFEDVVEDETVTTKIPVVKRQRKAPKEDIIEMQTVPLLNKSVPQVVPSTTRTNGIRAKRLPSVPTKKLNKREMATAQMFQERCRQICLSVFFRENDPVHSLGFTSSISGEGKSFLSVVTARTLANDSNNPVTLLECNWDHPTLHEAFGCSLRPGLAEWLRGECNEMDIRYQIDDNLTFIPAGNGKRDAVKLLQKIKQEGFLSNLSRSNELFIVDLPAIVTTAYGSLAANLVESLVVVVQAGVTPDAMIAEACTKLENMPVQGVILNQLESRIPRWIRQIL